MTTATNIRLAPSAVDCYDARVTEINSLLSNIQMLVGKLDRRENPHWGHAGDLHRVAEPLREMQALLVSMTRDL